MIFFPRTDMKWWDKISWNNVSTSTAPASFHVSAFWLLESSTPPAVTLHVSISELWHIATFLLLHHSDCSTVVHSPHRTKAQSNNFFYLAECLLPQTVWACPLLVSAIMHTSPENWICEYYWMKLWTTHAIYIDVHLVSLHISGKGLWHLIVTCTFY